MRSRLIVVSLAVGVVACAGCGSSSPTATTAASGATGQGRKYVPYAPAKSTNYTLELEGFEGGSPNGSARAEITINVPTLELCWRFSELVNVPHPTVAKLFRDFSGSSVRNGLLLGDHYKPSGCVKENELAFREIEHKPERIFINIHTARYPEGAVLGPLVGTGKPLNPTKP